MAKPLFSLWGTLLVAAGLIIPEYLRTSAKSLEPYPAVILPAGADTLDIKNDVVRVRRIYVMGIRNDKWEPLDVGELMFPIAEHYFPRLARRNFGLKRGKRLSSEQRAKNQETKDFFKGRLKAQGFETSKLRMVVESMSIRLPSGEKVSSRTSNKETYDLD